MNILTRSTFIIATSSRLECPLCLGLAPGPYGPEDENVVGHMCTASPLCLLLLFPTLHSQAGCGCLLTMFVERKPIYHLINSGNRLVAFFLSLPFTYIHRHTSTSLGGQVSWLSLSCVKPVYPRVHSIHLCDNGQKRSMICIFCYVFLCFLEGQTWHERRRL